MNQRTITGVCYIFGALPVTELAHTIGEGDFLIAADKGIDTMEKFHLKPDMVVGDFDSLGYVPRNEHLVKLNVRKDDTDTAHAMNLAFDAGYRDFVIYGAVGGRLEHTIANIQLASDFAQRGADVLFVGEREFFKVLNGGKLEFPETTKGRISVFALSEKAQDVSIRGLSYEVEAVTLENRTPLGVSNEFVGKKSDISVENGQILVIWDRN